MLDTNTVGYALVALGALLFLMEAAMPGFFVAVPGTILLVLGLFAVVSPGWNVFSTWAPLVVVVVGVPSTLGTIYFYRRMAPPENAPTTMSADALVGRKGIVTREVVPDSSRGKVTVAKQSWSATSDAPIPEGAHVRVRAVEGVTLVVDPASDEPLKSSETV